MGIQCRPHPVGPHRRRLHASYVRRYFSILFGFWALRRWLRSAHEPRSLRRLPGPTPQEGAILDASKGSIHADVFDSTRSGSAWRGGRAGGDNGLGGRAMFVRRRSSSLVAARLGSRVGRWAIRGLEKDMVRVVLVSSLIVVASLGCAPAPAPAQGVAIAIGASGSVGGHLADGGLIA